MRQRSQNPIYRFRFWCVISVLILATCGLIWRMVDLTVLHSDFLKGQGDARTLRFVNTPAHRGMILDRQGRPLAISTPVDSIWINPQEFEAYGKNIAPLAKLLNLSQNELRQLAKSHAQREFVYLKRGLSPEVGEKIKALDIEGVYLRHEYRRFYPAGEVSAQLLGFTNVDDQGQEGLELAYNQWLGGTPGRKRVLRDRTGRIVSEVNTLREPRPGQNLMLSVDHRIQYVAYRELQKSVMAAEADAGSAIALDVNTGEVLAMVNYPSFNPNLRPKVRDARYRNRAVTDLIEPASAMKTFSMLSGLSSGKINTHSLIDTTPGFLILDGKRVMDEHKQGVINLTTLLKVSSNVGISKIALLSPPEHLWNTLYSVGFGQSSFCGFPGESSGSLPKLSELRPFTLATLSFGYGMQATALQLAQAYAVLANDGMKYPISLLRLSGSVAGQQVVDPTIARKVREMLEAVISQGGTAKLAKVDKYRVTGKTGTARLLGPEGHYIKGQYNSSFIGMAPASKPRLLVAVVLYNTHGRVYYGGYTAGPAFSRIMGESLRLLGIPPDNLEAPETDQPQRKKITTFEGEDA